MRIAAAPLGSLLCAPPVPAAQVAGPLVVSGGPNYFKDARGRVLVLSGSQTWNTFQDWGSNRSLQELDFSAYVSFLTTHGHNFTLLWTAEMPRFCGFPAAAGALSDLTAGPLPWLRTGPGNATDGGLKFDLTKFNPSFFDRLRTRTQALNDAGIYVGVYLFTGEWLNIFRCSNDGYPFTGANAITRLQDRYVEKTIDTLNDLPNVLWIVSGEAPADPTWNRHQISHIRAYESGKPHRHPIGYAAPIGSPDATVYNSDADWVAPAARRSPLKSCGTGHPACKVNVNDSEVDTAGHASPLKTAYRP